MNVTAIKENFGASVDGVNLASITDAEFDEVYNLWLKHKVVIFHGQDLSDDQLESFSARFGPLDTIPYFNKLDMTEAEFREKGMGSIYILPISNIEKDGQARGVLGDGEVHWHADTNYMEKPCVGMVLFGDVIPTTGGDTQFADQEGVYESLPQELRDRIETLSIKHDASHTSDGAIRPGFEHVTTDDPREVPGAIHQIVCTHPETGRKSVFLGRRAWASVVGLDLEESEALLDELWKYATASEHVLSHKWQRGDVVAWDNRCLLHHRESFAGEGQRLVKRCQINAR